MSDNFVLIGFMGSGKSSVARELSRLSGRLAVDTDSLLEFGEGRKISEIFAQEGEGYFRALEESLVKKMAHSLSECIIATGGGMPLFCDVSALGKIFFLDLPFDAILARMSKDEREKRPLFSDEDKARELFLSRREGYLKRANFALDATLSPFEIAKMVLDS